MKCVLGLLLVSSLLLNNIEASIPKCSDCTVFATGKDGTLWGWEDDSFCKLSSKCSSSEGSSISTTKTRTTTVIKKTTTVKKESSTTKTYASTTKASDATTAAATSAAPAPSVVNTSSSEAAASTTAASSATSASTTSTGDKKKDAAGNIICTGCSVTGTGGDGSFWGWEDNASCIIDNDACKLTSSAEPQKTNTPLQRGSDGVLICSTCEYTRIDDDTTTWNKENGEDCRVIGSRCGFNKTPHPWCGGCVVTGTGGDGALYGWENNASCLINEIECGFIEKPNGAATAGSATNSTTLSGNSKVEVDSGASSQYLMSAYTIVAALVSLLVL